MSGRLRRAGGGRDQRPALDVMLKAATRGEFDDVAAWSVDRLGRSLQHLLDLTGHLLDLSASPLKVDIPRPNVRSWGYIVAVPRRQSAIHTDLWY